jgi:asparagine synthase (glutamine-hydrolysing)
VSGFVAVVHADGRPADAELIGRLTESMANFCQDGSDTYLAGPVALGHALFSADPDPADHERQPATLDGRVWIAADARVDGRQELVAALRARGVAAATDAPDAHLLLHAYEAWGERCVERVVGDFAFTIWDERERRLVSARDHFGLVPLYYAHTRDGFLVSNVLKAMRLHPEISDALDERTVGDILLVGFNGDLDATVFADIRAVPPAHMLTWRDGQVSIRRYWRPADRPREVRFERPEEYAERFRVVFDAAVGDRLRSNRVATQLSGGMDSTSVAATARMLLAARGQFDMRAYTVVHERLIAEQEGPLAEVVAEFLHLPLERIVVEDYVAPATGGPPPVALAEPRPYASNQSVQYELARRTASFARAVLTGMGGDPLFRVVPTWPAGPRQWRDRIAWAARMLARGSLPQVGIRAAAQRRRIRGTRLPELPSWIAPEFARRADLAERWRELLDAFEPRTSADAMTHPLWPSMFSVAHPAAHPLPMRTLYPFFDVRLATFVWETPAFPWRSGKHLLRAAMQHRLPRVILDRPKTPLFAGTGRPDPANPEYRLALEPAVRRWRRELMTAPALAEFVAVHEALARVEAPVPAGMPPLFDNCLALAHWLYAGGGASEAARGDTLRAAYQHVRH